MLEARALTKRYGDTPAVQDFTYAFAGGKITTVVGPSGSGKSTVLTLIVGLKEPESGSVWLEGRDITALAPERRDFGLVFQNYALFPHLNVRENVEFGLRVRRFRRAERRSRAMETLELTRIAHLAERRITEVSGGEQQRVAIARALAIRPAVLLMDEPLSALDAKLREDLRAELLRLLRELALTTVYVTHDQTEAMSLGHEMVILNKGRIEQSGVPADLYLQPANLFVANFLGDSNVLAAERETASGKIHFAFAERNGSTPAPAEKCWAMIRPEALELVPQEHAHFSALVESSTFLGNRLRLQLRAGNEQLIVDTANRDPIRLGVPVFVRVNEDEISTWPR